MAISKVELTDKDRGHLESSVRLRILTLEIRIEQAQEEYQETKKDTIRKMADYFRDEQSLLKDLASKLVSSRERGLIYEGEGTSEHIK